jgi:hypothetical protein
MAEPGQAHAAPIFLTAFNATPLLMLTAVILIAGLIAALSDGPSALMVLVTVTLLLTFAIQAALMFAPGF